MGERRLVHAQSLGSNAAGDPAAAAGAREQLRRLVADRERVAALLRAHRRAAAAAPAEGYRSSYAARLWALAEAAEPAPVVRPDPPPPSPQAAPLSLVEPPGTE